jgi:N6-L-threonylcarbamoyladenine synthase
MEIQGRPEISGGIILGIESSCDETAAAVVRAGGEVLANIVASQIALHANYGGVVPELASREHLRNIVPVVRAAMTQAGLNFADLDAIAVTEGPGLAGALLVGITYAKALALGVGKPLIAVNHLEGHINAVLMEARGRGEAAMETPLLALVVSGGHTHLYFAEESTPHNVCHSERSEESPHFVHATTLNSNSKDPLTVKGGSVAGVWRYKNVGRTVDDAAGEAYDKVAKLLGLGYPGGPWIDALAKHGNPRAVEFHFGQIKPRRAVASAEQKQIPPLRCGMTNNAPDGMSDKKTVGPTFDFSFSGIKTAVLRYTQANGMSGGIEARRAALAKIAEPKLADVLPLCDAQTLDLIASFQYAVVGNLMRQSFAAAEAFGAHGIVISGGVSANSELRQRFAEEAERRSLPVAFPMKAMSTDNAAMIAAAAWSKFVAGDFAGEGLVATPQLKLG